MSAHAQLVLAIGFTGLCVIATAAFMGWLLWSLAWDLYDHWMQQRTRRRMNRFAPRSSRDSFRDMKGVQR